jgi:hypothetical protein
MIKEPYYVSPDKQNPLFQQLFLQGRIHTRDYAFYMRKLAFMQQQQKGATKKKDEIHHHNNG